MRKFVISIALSFALLSCENKKSETIDANAFVEAVKDNKNIQLVDSRTPQEFNKSHMNNAINIDVNNPDWKQKLSQLDKSKPVYLYCLSGSRSNDMMKAMQEEGFKEVYNLDGGLAKLEEKHVTAVFDMSKFQQKSTSDAPGLNLEQLNAYVKEHKNVVVDFYADWCGPCKQMDPHLKELSEKNKDKFTLLKVNFDNSKELAKEFKIRGIPHLMIYKDGELVDRIEGFSPQILEEFKARVLKPFNK